LGFGADTSDRAGHRWPQTPARLDVVPHRSTVQVKDGLKRPAGLKVARAGGDRPEVARRR
ncbi:hypothetical protein, partial [Streptomyces sp. SM8]|uniref:hypothetical protein n=1 Tax=Streptomyces sp. SM8 TaxID=1195457 RepID=UPI001F1C309C